MLYLSRRVQMHEMRIKCMHARTVRATQLPAYCCWSSLAEFMVSVPQASAAWSTDSFDRQCCSHGALHTSFGCSSHDPLAKSPLSRKEVLDSRWRPDRARAPPTRDPPAPLHPPGDPSTERGCCPDATKFKDWFR